MNMRCLTLLAALLFALPALAAEQAPEFPQEAQAAIEQSRKAKEKLHKLCLFQACERGELEMIKRLILVSGLPNPSLINCQDDKKETFLMKAACGSSRIDESSFITSLFKRDLKAIASFLLLHGARTDLKNNDGNTALHLAAANNNLKIVKLLLKHIKAKQAHQAAETIMEEQHNE